mmetsp:Transcript_9846/g.23305  ORF Transcript_9846/g.23305 Transcript_9846/m.23305 type:complete len:254 (+) Transcript_9846:160-921(+)
MIINEVVKGPDGHVGRGIGIDILAHLNPHIGLAVLLLPLFQQILEILQRIVGLQEGTVRVALDALDDHLRVDVEPNHDAGLELRPVLDPRYEAPAGADDASDVGMDGVQNLRLDVAESLFSLGLEYVGDGQLGRLFNDRVSVQEIVRSHSPRHNVTDGALATAHHPDEVQVGPLQPRPEEAGGIDLHLALLSCAPLAGGSGIIAVLIAGLLQNIGILVRILHPLIELVGRVLPFESAGRHEGWGRRGGGGHDV